MIFDVLKFILILVEVILIFNLMILVHELGHFLAAKWRGLVVEKFAIWFGKPIWSRTINGVEYRLGSIPAGGFVAIPQLAPMEMMEGEVEQDRSQYPPAKPLDKIIVAFAGPLFSFLLAVLFAVIVWVVGRPIGEGDLSQTVGYVLPESPAAQAGLKPGDKIVAIDGHSISQFSPAGNARESIVWNIARSEGEQITVEIERDGQLKTLQVTPSIPVREGWGRKNLRTIGILPSTTPKVAFVVPDGPAAAANLQPGDLLTYANGQQLLSERQVRDILKETKGQPVTLTIKRGNETFDATMTPQIPAEGGTLPLIGIVFDHDGQLSRIHPNPVEQIVASVTTMWDTLAAVLSPKSEIGAEHLSGPVGIMNAYYLLFQRQDGWLLAIWFSVVLNINLALLNLLPIPVLDGGHITLAIVEKLLRRPVNVRILEFLQNGFALALIGFMLYVTFFDVLDIPRNSEATPKADSVIKFAAPEPEPGAAGR